MNEQVRKGQLLLVKTPPYFEKEYFYEVISAGEKLIRASLYHSPKVKRSWTLEQFTASIDMGIIRFAKDGESPPVVAR
ncbi:MAG: hypothetical protein P4L53_24035 [Candidatus Obscuribacterales bacterium]|jgi:hypothetical protein|nr:hypothetical protein [Candidatus Obscuribacterales bacterium]